MTSRHIVRRVVPSLILVLFAGCLQAEPELDEDWLDWDLEERIAAVGSRELRLLPNGVPAETHIHRNQIRIQAASLVDGWVVLDQCHEHLDPVPALVVTFKAGRIRGLQVTSAKQIGVARAEGNAVQLEDVEAGARLCLSAEIRALRDLGGGYYRLRNGPYMRRFLDGYYPMQVQLDIAYPAEILDFVRPQPPAQPGLEVRFEPGRLRVDASFDGELYTCMDFRIKTADVQEGPDVGCPGD